jgi:apolipoprotein D and lipocalin family protein
MSEESPIRSPLKGYMAGPWALLFMVAASLAGVVIAYVRRRRRLANPPETVAEVDLERYAGGWYEIARLPVRFQRSCVATTAEYELVDERTLRVLNRCQVGTLDGPTRTVKGKAWVPDEEQPGKLKVRLGFWPFPADYWIVLLGEDYRYSVVTVPDRSRLWILSRTPSLEEATLDRILERLEARGFPTVDLVYTYQPEDIFGGEE